jgi:predicted membrane protein
MVSLSNNAIPKLLNPMERKRFQGRTILGIILVLIGLLMIGRSLNIFPYEIAHDLFSWPMILIVLGVIFLISRPGSTSGWILLIIGGVFMLERVTDVSDYLDDLFWPVIFIGIGLLILVKSLTGFRRKNYAYTGGSDVDYIDEVAILGGSDRKITSQGFKGGQITSIFGGSQINLVSAQLAKGDNVIDVFSLFGGSTLIVPRNWNVKVEVTSILGGFSDKRAVMESSENPDEGILIIKGLVLFGGGEIKNV